MKETLYRAYFLRYEALETALSLYHKATGRAARRALVSERAPQELLAALEAALGVENVRRVKHLQPYDIWLTHEAEQPVQLHLLEMETGRP